MSQHDLRRDRKVAHSAGILGDEITVTYPFHPLAKRTFIVLSQHEHYGSVHVQVRGADGARYLLPAWMTSPEAGEIEIVAVPRLSVCHLAELRRFLDGVMIALSSGENPPIGGLGNGEMEDSPAEPVRGTAGKGGAIGSATREGIEAARIALDRSDRSKKRRRKNGGDSGGRH